MKKKEIYTFEDWLENNFWNEVGYSGQLMVNDSENYLELVMKGKMTYDTLNQIQDAQSETYQYIIEKTIETNRKFLLRTKEKSLDFNEYLRLLIEKIELDFEKNRDLYFDVIKPRIHRGIKYGAKFILPEEFKKFSNSEFVDGYLPISAPYANVENGAMKHFPVDSDKERGYLRMEIQFHWIKYLKEIRNGAEIVAESTEPNAGRKEGKLSDLITHRNSVEIVEALKIQYKNIKGKRLKLLLMALQDLNLLPKERIAQRFYQCCKSEFDWNINSYQAMNDHKYNYHIDRQELDEMKKIIETLTR
jgi:hypothetical protein